MERHEVPTYGRSAPKAYVRSPTESNFPRSPVTNSFPRSPVTNSFPRSPVINNFPRSPTTDSFPRPPRPPPSREHSSTRPPPSRDGPSIRPPPSRDGSTRPPTRDPDYASRRDPSHIPRRDLDHAPRREMPAFGRLGSKSSMHSLRNNPARPAPRPPLSPLEAEDLAKRLKASYLAHEEDAQRAEAEAKRNYDNLEDEMVMARKFKNDNASEKRKIELQTADIREKLQDLRASWEAARAAHEEFRRKEPEMQELKKQIDNGWRTFTLAEMERKKDVWREYTSNAAEAKEQFEKVNEVKCKLIEEDKAMKDKDGRRLKRFNGGIEGHDKRRFAMRSRLARACHYTIYHAKRSHNYLLELARLTAPPMPPSPTTPTTLTTLSTHSNPSTPLSSTFPLSPAQTDHKAALLALEAQIERAEGYLKGPIDTQTGERFWTMHAHRSWWVKIPEGPLGFPPSP